ncbi:MAG: bacteriohemerythrin [Sulfurisoma sp.]|nr:bacteriohemerythrin [Sulfurisoma sp.]
MSAANIEWSPVLEIGHPAIDRQHRKLFDLAALLVHDGNHGQVIRILAELSEYVIVHFRDEEKLLGEIGFPGLEAHRKSHEDFRARMAKLFCDAGSMTLDDIAAEIRLLINEWLTRHILVADQEYAKYLPGNPA